MRYLNDMQLSPLALALFSFNTISSAEGKAIIGGEP
jgi:hypothetical protein